MIFFGWLGIYAPPRPSSPRWHHRTLPEGPGQQVQLREDDLSEMLRTSTTEGYELPEEEVRTFQSVETEEEDQVGSVGGLVERMEFLGRHCE